MAKKTTDIQKDKRPLSKSQVKQVTVKFWELPFYVTAAFFVVLTMIFFGSQLFGSSYFWEDFLEYVYPVQTFAAKEWLHNGIPFWNHYIFNGMPFIADIQVGFFYPLNRILSLFVSGNGLPVGVLEFVIIIHFLISLFNMYFLSRYWKISTYGSLIAAVSYSFSMLLVCHVIHPMIVYHLAWLPLVTMLFLKGIHETKIKWAILAGLIFGMSFLSGHPQMTLYTTLFLGFVFLWQIIAGIKYKEFTGKRLPLAVIYGILPFIIAVGIFAIQYYPSRELAGLSQRSETSFEKSSEGSYQYKHIYEAVVPHIFGSVDGNKDAEQTFYLKYKGKMITYYYWESAFYFGVVALVLGLFGALVHYKNRTGAMFIVLSIFGILFALGENSFLYGIFYNLPLFGTFRNPGRMLFMTIMGFGVLAGFGFDSLWKLPKNKELLIKLIIASAIPLVIAVLCAVGFIPKALDAPENAVAEATSSASVSLLFIAGVVLIGWLLNRTILNPTLAGSLLAIIAFIDLFLAGGSFNKSNVNPAEVYTLSPQLKQLFTPHPPKDIFRVNSRIYQPVPFMACQRNQGMIDNIMFTEGYNPLILERVQPSLPQGRDAIYDLDNVRYQVEVDTKSGSWYMKKKETAFPRAWIVHRKFVFKPEEVNNKMKYNLYDYHHETIVEKNPDITLPETIDSTINETVECTSFENNSFAYNVTAVQPGLVVFSEIWYPAWKAYVDGKPTEILRADYCYRAVPVSPGNHKIEMRYESDAYKTGSILTIITLLGSVVGFGVALFFERSRNKKNEVEK